MSKINPALAALVRPISSLKLHDKNARTHDERNLKHVADSLATFEQQKPIVVASDGVVMAGNGTLQAALRLGWTEIAVVEMDVPSDDPKARGYAVADNRSSDLSAFDKDALLLEVDALRELGDVAALGFSDAEIKALRSSGGIELYEYEEAKDRAREFVKRDLLDPRHAIANATATADGPADAPFEQRVAPGDVWQLGRHRLICGDSMDAENLAALFEGQKAQLVNTDPPYLVNYTGDRPAHLSSKPITNSDKDPHFGTGKNWSEKYNEFEMGDAGAFYARLFTAARTVADDNAAYYVWHAEVRAMDLIQAARDAGLLIHQWIIWVKPCATMGHMFWQYRHEPCLMGWVNGNKPRLLPHDNETTVWECDWDGSARSSVKFHPITKPVELFCKPMRMHTIEHDVVFEPFCGSGSCLIAGELLKRRVFACELFPHFCDGILDRWEKFVGDGQKAVKVGHVDQAGKLAPVGPKTDDDEGPGDVSIESGGGGSVMGEPRSLNPVPPPELPCWSCRGRRFFALLDRLTWVCARCHPPWPLAIVTYHDVPDAPPPKKETYK